MESFRAFSEELREERELRSLAEFFKMLGSPHTHPAPVDGAEC